MLSFSAEVKQELSKLNNLNNKNQIKAEISGYMFGSNYAENNQKARFITENEFNIYRLNKLLENLNINYTCTNKGKSFICEWNASCRDDIMDINIEEEEIQKAVVRGAFMASGSLNEPNKKYHLELLFSSKENAEYVFFIMEKFGIVSKLLKRKEKYFLYIKDSEEISKFLALIGAKKAVLNYEEIRIIREMRSNVNRLVNCETANINKTINVAVNQIADINFIKKKNKFEELPANLKEIANIRIQNPDSSLVELGKLLDKPIGKSGVNHRLKKLQEIAAELREE